MMRVRLFARDAANRACGGRSLGSIDATGGRYEQGVIPDLDLIRRRGLSEPDPAGDKLVSLGPCASRAVPHYFEWIDLASPWADVLLSAVHNNAVIKLRRPTAKCLRQRSGLDVADDDPTVTFISAADYALSASRERGDLMDKLSRVYANCASDYFAAIVDKLLKVRPAVVERNRELLEAFAAEISAAGYVP